MTWIYAAVVGLLAGIGFIVWLMRREKKAGKTEAKAGILEKHAEIMDEINEDDRTWNDDTRDPETEDEWDYFYLTGRKPDRVRRHDPKR